MSQLFKILVILSLSMAPFGVMAQDPADPGGDPDAVPIDGGASMLVGAAAVYALKKIKDRKKTEK